MTLIFKRVRISLNRLRGLRRFMAKFNKGELGGIYYKAVPTGLRRFLRVGRIRPIPYIAGNDIDIILLIRLKDGKWWTEGILKPDLPIEYPNNPFETGIPDKKGKWTKKLHIWHPSTPMTFSCDLQLQNVQETDNYLRPVVESVSTKLIEDIRVVSLSSFLAWVSIALIAIAGLVVGILNWRASVS